MSTLEITLTKGLVGKPGTQRRVVQALGLTKYGSSVTHTKTPTIMGMVNKVHHLVTVKETAGAGKEKTKETTKKQAGKSSKSTVIESK